MADLSQYGTVSSALPDLSAYGVISGDPPVNTKFGKGNSIFDSPLLVNTPPGSSTDEHTGEAIASPQSQLAVAALTGTGLEAAAAAAGHTLPSFLGKLAIGTVAGGLAHKGAKSVGLPDWAAQAAGLIGGAAGMSSTGQLGELLSEYKGPDSILGFLRFAASKGAKGAADPLLDDFAQRIGYKDFNSAPADAQKSLQALFKASQEAPGRTVAAIPLSRPAYAPPQASSILAQPADPAPAAPYRPPVTFVGGRPVRPPLANPSQENEQAIQAAMERLRALGAAPPVAVEPAAGVSPEVAAPAAEPKTELEDLLERSLNGEKVAEQAKAELNDHLKLEALKKTESIIDKHQTTRALKLGRFLQDYGIPTEHIEKMTPEEWQQVGSVAEVENPSATTIEKTKALLKMGQSE